MPLTDAESRTTALNCVSALNKRTFVSKLNIVDFIRPILNLFEIVSLETIFSELSSDWSRVEHLSHKQEGAF